MKFHPDTHELRNGDRLVIPPARDERYPEMSCMALLGVTEDKNGVQSICTWTMSGREYHTIETELDIVEKT